MVLGTNVKRFKYTFIFKFLCIVLSLVTCAYSGFIAYNTIAAADYFGNRAKDSSLTDFTESSRFRFQLRSDLSSVISEVQAQSDRQHFLEKANADKKRLVEEAYKQYISFEKAHRANQAAWDAYENEDIDYDAYDETTIEENTDIDIQVKGTSTTISLFCYEISDSLGENPSEEAIKEEIERQIDDAIGNAADNYVVVYYAQRKTATTLMTYTEYDGHTVTNIEDKNARSNLNKYDIYFIYENGKLTMHGICDSTVEYMEGLFRDNASEGLVLYGYLDLPSKVEKNTNILEDIENYDEYTSIMKYYDTAVQYYTDMNQNIAKAVIFLAASAFLWILYLTVAGKKSEDEKAKLAFVDYIPVELHLGIWVACGFGLIYLLFGILESYFFLIYEVLLVEAAGVLIWLMLTEFCASVARLIKSDRKFYKSLLTYWILFGIFMAVKYMIKGIVFVNKKAFSFLKNSVKKMRDRTQRVFTYKPKKFTRNIILLAILYFVVNLIIITLGVIGVASEMLLFALFFIIVFVVGNVVIIREVCRYFKNLDLIILSSQSRQTLIPDIDALPESLKILANSMRYTNIELQNAINKAVKDERLRTELITNVSHDLKTPLTSIITYVDLLSKCDINDPKAQEYIRVLDEKGARLKRLIDDLIEASKVTTGNVTVNLAPMNLSELCLQSTVDVQSDFEKAGLELVVKQGENPSIVVADGTKTFRVIQNLLSNARKYSAKGSRVYVSVYNEGDSGIFEVKNISAQPLDITPDELTERFVRGDQSRNQEGNGLGLSIAKELCRLQNGQLQLYIDGDLFKARVRFPLNKQ